MSIHCRPCDTNIRNGLPPRQHIDEEEKAIDARLLANGRCGVCFLMNPCGGHRSAADYANMRREIV